MALELPRLPQTQPNYQQWQVWWEEVAEAVEDAFNALEDTVNAIAAAQAAADAANAAAATAQAAADDANAVAADIEQTNALGESYVSGATLGATDAGANATITISAHNRIYPNSDGTTTSVAVNGGSVTGLAYDTIYYIYYDDATRTGGAVTYQATTTEETAAQIGDRHTVGAIKTPVALAADTGGTSTRPPGTRAVDTSTL
jgi:hypothetical protein